jgi:hypothetical protein
MKYLQTFSVFESQTSGTLTAKQKEFLNRYTTGTWSVNPATGLVDVQGSFYCPNQGLKSLGGIQFGTVTGEFNCSHNELTILEGAPRTVGETFDCSHNQLTTLEGAPQTVKGDFLCDKNQLTSLEGAPQTVTGSFDCRINQLTTLEGAPQTVTGNFYCYSNKLTSLEGAPWTVEGTFNCDAFQLEPGKWNPTGWLEVLRTGSLKAQKLIQTLPYLQPDWWNSELRLDPAKSIINLKKIWHMLPDEMKRGIKIPQSQQGEFEVLTGLSSLGF